MRSFPSPLPIDEALPALGDALRAHNAAVLVAPPGAGKTTRVPLALLDEEWLGGKSIILLEPRRLAARGAAERMAKTLGERVGDTVGLRVRLGSKVSARTRIVVVTEGVFTRMIIDDPELTGIGAVFFDEFHERSLDADSGLAFALDAQGALRPDLRILVMSATIDGARVASLMEGAPLVRSEGRSFPVETRHIGRDPAKRIEDQVVDAALRALRADAGSLLIFLPGQAPIERVADRLRERIADPNILIAPLYGAMDQRAQDEAVSPTPAGKRKIVLATSIAETSLTIEGVRVVIDSGLARVPRYEPDIGVTRLETVRVSRAAADQRRGRAGRTEPGVCYRLWDEAATGALEPFARPEILDADLSGLLLDCGAWGVSDPTRLRFLDPPPAPALNEARALLRRLDAIDRDGRLTDAGARIRALPLPPRLARMTIDAAARRAAQEAAEIAAVIVERGLGGDAVDLAERLDRFARDRGPRASGMRHMAADWARQAAQGATARAAETEASPAALLALAYPDRIARARGKRGDFVMANGRGATLPETERLAREEFIVVADVSGGAASARILLAARSGRPRRGRGRSHPRRRRGRVRPRHARASRPARPQARRHHARRETGAGAGHDRIGAGAGAGRGERRRRPAGMDEGAEPASRPDQLSARRADQGRPKRRGGAVAGPFRRGARGERRGLARALHRRPDAARRDRRGRAAGGARHARALCAAARTRREDADAFHRADRIIDSHRLFLRGRTGAVGAGAGTVRARPSSRDRGRIDSADAQPAFAGASADPDHQRPARLLARLMGGGARRSPRALSEASLAGESARGGADDKSEAKGDVRAIFWTAAPDCRATMAPSALRRLTHPWGPGSTVHAATE